MAVNAIGVLILFLFVLIPLASFLRRRVDKQRKGRFGLFPYLCIALAIWMLLYWGSDVVADFTARRMDLYSSAMNDVGTSVPTKAVLGSPVTVGWPVRISANIQGSEGAANLEIPVRGSRGRGVVYAFGQKNGGVWQLKDLYLVPQSSSERIPIAH
jgi:hypothetical protein